MRKPYPSDMTDDQWAILEPLIPVSALGRPRDVEMREVLNAISYQAHAGCQWDTLPHDSPPKSTVFGDFKRWRDDGTWQTILDALRRQVRQAVGRRPSPGAGSMDSRRVKGSEVGGERGDDGGKELRGRKRHIVVDSPGMLPVVLVTAASADDGTTAPRVLGRLTAEQRSRLGKVWADGKYHNHSPDAWMRREGVGDEIEVVIRPAGAKGLCCPIAGRETSGPQGRRSRTDRLPPRPREEPHARDTQSRQGDASRFGNGLDRHRVEGQA